jgi:hypothetical protein
MEKIKKLTFSFLFFIISITVLNAQTEDCSCKKDFEFLNQKIQQIPSYKVNKVVYELEYTRMKKNILNLNSGYECFLQLNKLMLSLNDRHCNLYGINTGLDEESKKDLAKFETFKTSELFTVYPRPKINLDSLRTTLKQKSITSIEGIYYRKGYMTLGVYKTAENDFYSAIILDSENDVWEVGEVIYTLIPYGNNYLLAVGGSLTSKRMIAYGERIENGVFLTMQFQKNSSLANYSVSKYPESTYLRKEISSETTYLKVGSFNSWNPTLSEADKFYKSLKGTLTTKNLILDLRDNGGGGDRNSNGLYKILKKYIKRNNVYVLVNHRTASNAEQFAYKLSDFENCTVLGNRTSGTAAYEMVNSNYNLPCKNYVVVLTSKKHTEYLKLESTGIEPDIKLDIEKDWMIQVQNYIQRNN